MTRLLVTGTGTGVGKTVVTAGIAALALAAGRSVTVVKPAQTGVGDDEDGDLAEVVRLAGEAVETVEVARYPDPLAPEAAARRSGQPYVDRAVVADVVRRALESSDVVLVEGAGGLLVRYDDRGLTAADVARDAALPVLVVSTAGLGTLNAVALTVEAIRARGLELAGVVVGAWPAEPDLASRSNLRDLESIAGTGLLGAVPEGVGTSSPSAFLAVAGESLAPSLGGVFDAAAFRAAHDD